MQPDVRSKSVSALGSSKKIISNVQDEEHHPILQEVLGKEKKINNRFSNIQLAFKNMNKFNSTFKAKAINDNSYLTDSMRKLEQKRLSKVTISLDIQNRPALHVNLDDMFQEGNNFKKRSCQINLENHLKHFITSNTGIPPELKEKVKSNIDNSYYYITFNINGRHRLFEDSTMLKYFNFCARNDETPHLFVHFLCTYAKVVKYNPAA